METMIQRSKLAPARAILLEKKYHIVNDSGKVYEFVGIGWINITDEYTGNLNDIPHVVD